MADHGGGNVEHEGIAYTRHRILPDRATLIKRMTNRNQLNTAAALWLRPPAEINAAIYWKVMEGNRVLVDASTGLKTLGVIEKTP